MMANASNEGKLFIFYNIGVPLTCFNGFSTASRLLHQIYLSGSNLSRSASSVGEHQSDAYVSPILPKRSETFGGFDAPLKETNGTSSKKKIIQSLKDISVKLRGSTQNLKQDIANEKTTEHFSSSKSYLSVKDVDTRRFSDIPALDLFVENMHNESNSATEKSLVNCKALATSMKSLVNPQSPSPPSNVLSAMASKNSIFSAYGLSTTSLLFSYGKEQMTHISELQHQINLIMVSFGDYKMLNILTAVFTLCSYFVFQFVVFIQSSTKSCQ